MAIVLGNRVEKETNTGTEPITWSHTIADNPDRVLIVAIFMQKPSGSFGVSGVTYGGVALERLYDSGTVGTYHRMVVYYLKNPPVGTATVSVAPTSTVLGASFSVDYSGVETSAPFGDCLTASGTASGAEQLAVTTNPADSRALVLSFLGRDYSGDTPAAGAGVAVVADVESSSATSANNCWMLLASAPGGKDAPVSWSWSNSRLYFHAAVALNPKREGRKPLGVVWWN